MVKSAERESGSVVDGKPVRVGVLGVDRYSPVWQKAGPAGTNLGIAAPADMIATYLPEVRAKSDVVVLLVHEGASGTDCTKMDDDPTSDFGSIIHGVNDNVDAIVSGHTHLEYNCSFPVPGWSGRAVTERPVVSAGQYGTNLNKLVFTVDPDTGEVVSKTQTVLKLKESNTGPNNYPVDQPTQDIVDAAVAARFARRPR